MKTWYWVRQGRVMREISDYILGTYRRHFKIVGIRGVRNHPSDHFALRSWLLIFPTEAGHNCDIDQLTSQIGTVNGGRKETRSYKTHMGVGLVNGTGDRVTMRRM